MHSLPTAWAVELHEKFDVELMAMPSSLRITLLSHASAISMFGPELGRPLVDTLDGSRHANMKELRFSWEGGAWRVAFAFDPLRRAILLVAGDKRGKGQRHFYKRLIAQADSRYEAHLAALAGSK
ncbi:MAG: addiction module toxin RelE [Betaproteobacteria bacterium]|nr:addiction module toxin RelE [Betaproteobacteria bacterium]